MAYEADPVTRFLNSAYAARKADDSSRDTTTIGFSADIKSHRMTFKESIRKKVGKLGEKILNRYDQTVQGYIGRRRNRPALRPRTV